MSDDSHADLQISAQPRFQFVRELGRGVLGAAYEVIDEVRAEPVVLKVFMRCRPRNLDAFKLEFESLARLEHPALVRYHHFVDPLSDTNISLEDRLGHGGFAFTQEYIDGMDLLAWLNRPATDDDLITLDSRRTPTTGDLPLPEELSEGVDDEVATRSRELSTEEVNDDAIASSIIEELASASSTAQKPPLDLVLLRLERIVPQLVAGLQYLHRYHKVHGFLRPSNILVTRAGQCKLTDYGIVPGLEFRPRDDGGGPSISLLRAPEHLPYVAPEQSGEATAAGDLFALGCVLFEAVAGYPPADAMQIVGARTRHLEVPPLAELVSECPAEWAERIDALLRPDPRDRPALAAIAHVMGEGRAVRLPHTVLPEPKGFVGQSRLLAELRSEAQDVTDNSTMRFVLLEGVAGAGKSMLVEEFAHWLSRRGWLVLTGRCFNRESVPLQGWQEIAKRLAGVVDGLPPQLQEGIAADRQLAGVLFPELGVGAPPERPVGRLAAIRALRRLLGFVSEQRPVLLCLEDLHWASSDTAALLMDLFSESAKVRCLILGSWRTDSERSAEHFLTRDLEISFVFVRRLVVQGFTTDEAREFLISRAPGASLDELRKILRVGRANPRLLGELLWELEHDRLDEAPLTPGRDASTLQRLLEKRMEDLGKPEEAMLHLLAVASGPIEHDWLRRAVAAEVAGSVLPNEQTVEAIESAFARVEELRFVRRGHDASHRTEWAIADDASREVVLEQLTDRDVARLCGRIADTIGDDRPERHDLRFEYQLRAARVGKAMKAAVRSARGAEARFAYHRAAKLWRWLMDNQSKLDDPSVNPGAELARVEHLAGQHGEAARLYHSWAEGTVDRVRRAKIRGDEAAAWLQSGDADSAIRTLDLAMQDLGQRYVGAWHAPISETPRRWVATLSRWNERLVEEARPGAADKGAMVLAGLYDFGLQYEAWLDSSRAAELEARLARLASTSEDALILATHRMRLALLHASDGLPSRRERAFAWMTEAQRIAAQLEDPARIAQTELGLAILQIRYGDYRAARESLSRVMSMNEKAEAEQRTDRRWSLYYRALLELRSGRLADADRLARQLLHTYRGDCVAASNAYALLTDIALLRGEAEVAAVYFDAGREAVHAAAPNESSARWFVPQSQVHIALGRPEVAVGQLQVIEESLRDSPLGREPWVEIPLQLALGYATAALAERQRLLAEPRQDATRALLRGVQRRLEGQLEHASARQQAEIHRLAARCDIVAGKPRRALKHAEAAIEALGDLEDPVAIGRCTEARAHVLVRLERPEARGIIEQAWELYRFCGVNHPLVLEGWPVPREGAMLKED